MGDVSDIREATPDDVEEEEKDREDAQDLAASRAALADPSPRIPWGDVRDKLLAGEL